MLWTMRLVIFAFALAFGVGAWFVFAHAQTPALQTTNTNVSGNMNASPHYVVTNTNVGGVVYDGAGALMNGNTSANWSPHDGNSNSGHGDGAADASEAEPPVITWGEPASAWGHAVAPRITLRSEPSASANVVATLDLEAPEEGYESAEILESTRDFLRVKFHANSGSEGGTRQQDYEGWVEWGAFVPYASALVVDAGSGEVVGRLPLEGGVSSVAFSPDGKRALFYGASYGGEHGGGSSTAYEVDAESYKVLRVLNGSGGGGFASFLYDGPDELRALAQTHHSTEDSYHTKLHPFTIKGDLIERRGDALRPEGTLIFSGDGLIGLDILNSNSTRGPARVHVIDLRTLAVRNSFELTGDDGSGDGWPHEYAVSPDGAEFYYRGGADGGSVVAVDTRTGARVREVPLVVPENFWAHLWQGSLAGDSLLVKFWREAEDGVAASHSVWLRPDGKTAPAEKGIDQVIEAGGSRYAVNEAGTRLFKLDDEGRITERLKIARPESKHRPKAAEEFTIMGLQASPDGKHIVIFLGIPDGC